MKEIVMHTQSTMSAAVLFIDVKLSEYKIQKHFPNVMLVRMASEISKNYTYKCVDRSRHNGIKGAKAKCALDTSTLNTLGTSTLNTLDTSALTHWAQVH